MQKKLMMFLMVGLLLTSVIPLTLGVSESKKLSTAVCGEGDYNLLVDVEADRHVSPHSYGEGVDAAFLVWVLNNGQNDSSECNVNCSITRLFVVGQKSEVVFHTEWTEKPQEPRTGHGTTVTFGCPIPGKLFAVYKIQATIDSNDNNLDDNTDSFIFFVVWVGWLDW